MAERKRSKTEERAYAGLQDALHELAALKAEMWARYERLKLDTIPGGWLTVEEEHPVRPKKVRITASYDEDVARFFRTMGHGYQARMNAVLRAYMLAVVSREIRLKRNEDWKGDEI